MTDVSFLIELEIVFINTSLCYFHEDVLPEETGAAAELNSAAANVNAFFCFSSLS